MRSITLVPLVTATLALFLGAATPANASSTGASPQAAASLAR